MYAFDASTADGRFLNFGACSDRRGEPWRWSASFLSRVPAGLRQARPRLQTPALPFRRLPRRRRLQRRSLRLG